MATNVKLKRSAVQSRVPTTTDLGLGELGLNTYDGKVYMKKDDGTASVIEIGAAPDLTPYVEKAGDNMTGDLTLGTDKIVLDAGDGSITAAGDLTIADKITHYGNTATAVRFPANDTVSVETAGSERLRIDPAGRFLVGTLSARQTGSGFIAQSQVEGASTVSSSSFTVTSNRSVDDLGGRLNFARSKGGTIGSNTIVDADAEYGGIYFFGADGTDADSIGAQISAYVDSTPGVSDMPGRLVFSTTASGSASPTKRMVIDSSGDLKLGGTLPSAPNITLNASGSAVFEGDVGIGVQTPSAKLEVYGSARFKATDGSHGIEFYSDIGGLGYQRVLSYNRTSSAYEDLSFGASNFIVTSGGSAESLRITSTGQLSHIGGGSSGSPAVVFNGSAPSNSLVVNSSGAVGIGVTNPQAPLEVKTGSSSAKIKVATGSTASSTFESIRGSTDSSSILAFEATTNNGNCFNVNYAGGAYFKSNVGIGTDDPQARLDVSGGSLIVQADAGNNITLSTTVSNGNDSHFVFQKSRGGANGPTQIGATDSLGQIDWYGHNGTAYNRASSIRTQASTNTGDFDATLTYEANRHVFITTGESLRIASNGNVGIGETDPQAKLDVNGTGAFSGTLTATVVPPSDARFKENITPANPQLADVVALGGILKNYDWNEDAPVNSELRSARQLGLIAQEAGLVCPSLVKTIHRTKQGEEITPEVVVPAVYEDQIIPAVVDEDGEVIEPETTEQVLVAPEEVTPATYEELDDSYKGLSQDVLIMKLLGAVAELTARVEELESAS